MPRVDDRRALSGTYWRLRNRLALGQVKHTSRRVNILAFSPLLYRYRNLVEHLLSKIKHFRAVATRFEGRDANYLVIAKLAAARNWMRFMRR